ncbi:E3 ubiquitin-protein ligase RNF169 isoform X2 [Oryctolagus cuniculus]|uniref:E3 ubiquitin-protein ligase RNF169 isoform X2 n=1 Tax=Oryctolagus cuniculus TaxID=9986 RepID=UPI0022301EF1|nr:E3 ubiquitin-protein ligase RNF169 isoform X2 [Oryctolagus cuniculus]
MAAAGPSTRASSAAAAAALSRRGRRGRCDETSAAKTGAPGPAPGPALLVLPPPPLLQPPPAARREESGCAGCLETPVEAAALPCGHSLCRGCAQRAADAAGPGCPRCRARGPGWARRRARDDGQADAEVPGERARRGQPERCRPRRDGGAAAARPRPELEARAAPAEPEFIFRAPIKLSKPGELREEYESLRKCPARLSDSENEEPSRGHLTQTHRSAFVSKTNSYSLAFLAGKLSCKVERSQSCSDAAQDRVKGRLRAAPASKAKVTTITPASNPIIGVLLSTQNNRCLSAPDLTIEKRLPFSALSSAAPPQKPERSVSPESNDSISEELNHFKPIVCSPCTPPKRLPDGRVLSPLIIKSTPRNLNRSLQKQTSYEASPRILKKWEQIFQERQIKKTLSKATLTSLAPETGEDLLGSEGIHCSKEKPLPAVRARPSPGQVSPERPGPASGDLEDFPCVGQTKAEQGSACQRSTEPLVGTSSCSSEHRGAASGTSLDREQFEGTGATPEAKVDQTCRSTAPRASAVNSVLHRSSALGGVLKTKQQLKPLKPSDLANGVLADSLGQEPLPPLRRGRKRHCKTKHLEQNGSLKKLRAAGGEVGLAPAEPVLRELEQRARQEEEDRRLALRLQRVFDGERRAVSRRKGSVDQYLLRSSNVAGAK